jgi:hypothetical protein
VAIERRTCKHLRKLRGDAAEEARVGNTLAVAAPAKASKDDSNVPPLLLAESWDHVLDPTGWLMSEKLDGVRAYWKAWIQYLFCQGLPPGVRVGASGNAKSTKPLRSLSIVALSLSLLLRFVFSAS